jgi:hypothetical protein
MTKENSERRPYGIDLNTIPIEEPECKAIVPIDEPIPLATIPPKPHRYGCSYYAQPVHTKPLLLVGARSKGPIIALPVGTKIVPPKHNVELLGVKTNRKGKLSVTSTTLENTPTSRGFVLIQRRSNLSPRRKL